MPPCAHAVPAPRRRDPAMADRRPGPGNSRIPPRPLQAHPRPEPGASGRPARGGWARDGPLRPARRAGNSYPAYPPSPRAPRQGSTSRQREALPCFSSWIPAMAIAGYRRWRSMDPRRTTGLEPAHAARGAPSAPVSSRVHSSPRDASRARRRRRPRPPGTRASGAFPALKPPGSAPEARSSRRNPGVMVGHRGAGSAAPGKTGNCGDLRPPRAHPGTHAARRPGRFTQVTGMSDIPGRL